MITLDTPIQFFFVAIEIGLIFAIGYWLGRRSRKWLVNELFAKHRRAHIDDDAQRREAEQVQYSQGYLDGFEDGRDADHVRESDRDYRGRLLDRVDPCSADGGDVLAASGVLLDAYGSRLGVARKRLDAPRRDKGAIKKNVVKDVRGA